MTDGARKSAYDEKKAAELERKVREQTFTLADYLEQFDQLKNMGPLDQLLGMIPGVKADALKDVHVDDRVIERMKAIILSMTPEERDNPDIISSSRKIRIAKGSGMKVEDVNKLLKQFDQTRKMMKQMTSGNSPFGKLGGKMVSKALKKKSKNKKKRK